MWLLSGMLRVETIANMQHPGANILCLQSPEGAPVPEPRPEPPNRKP